ncbi:MAG: 50S ribosomal protein L10 [Clostridia bacterium]|jgi:large subunit ribosomal protein L10|nr:50S ribosomal protein L10 [Clostridia bacterium]MCI8944823.1 50S ribosomal protein L10 [Clostridia bacterium]MCI9290864.1 50S ribosomal protein L10 [Clostridia bacterium]MDE6884829.1 50S ribosomal protein L10 [Clostridia bacterium]
MAEERKSEARVQKEAHVEEIKELIKNCNGMVVVSYQGISVADDTQLRSKFRAENVKYKVLKNRLVQRAFQELGIQGFDGHLEGSSAFAFANGDALAAAKIVVEGSKTIKSLKAKCGLMDGAYIDENTVTKLASIPSKEVLLAQLLGLLQSPISGFARAIKQVAEKDQSAAEA